MERLEFRDFLTNEISRVLPHLEQEKTNTVIEFLEQKGCKKAKDLRIMTISLLETHLDLVDATDLHTEWQTKYGAQQPSTVERPAGRPTERLAATCRQAGQLENQVEAGLFGMPKFDKDSPYIPAKVRDSILAFKRPGPRDREEMVARIVDRCRDTVPHLKRNMFNSVADDLVSMYPASFKDTVLAGPNSLGSESLRNQFKNKFDNDKRPSRFTPKENEAPNIPAAFGCIAWSPALPQGETEDSQNHKKRVLQDMFRLSKRQWDWKTIKSNMKATFYLQRKDINGPDALAPTTNRKRKRTANAEQAVVQEEQPSRTIVAQLQAEWPFLFQPKGFNIHMQYLTGVDLKQTLGTYIKENGPTLIDFLSCKDDNQAKIRRKMLRAEARSWKSPTTSALIQMLFLYFKEDVNEVVTFVEETTDFTEVQAIASYPDDGTPGIIVAGQNLFSGNSYFLTVDQQVVASLSSLEDAVMMLFGFYFVLNLQYTQKAECVLTFIQRVIVNINPQYGSKGNGGSANQRKINQRVLRLSNGLNDYRQKLGDEEEEEREEEDNLAVEEEAAD